MTINVTNFVNKWSFLFGHKVYVGISGGVDSVVLLRLLVMCGFDVEALHVNYQLRGDDSNRDELFVRDLCETLNIPIHVKLVDTFEKLKKEGGNLQEVARKIRYDFFDVFLNKIENSFISIGHNQDDQIETFFLNLARKSGFRGMSCMLEIDEPKVRPLLNYSKEDIIRFAVSNQWKWREDKSNNSLKYRRNALRKKYIPEMIEKVPTLKDSVMLLVSKFQSELKEIQESIYDLYNSVLNSGFLSLIDFKELPQNQQVEILFKLGLNATFISSFYKLIDSQKGKFIEVEESFRIFREKDGFTFEKYFPKVCFKISKSETKKIPIHLTKNEIYFDADLIKGKLQLRTWIQRDRISPIGIKGSKLISDVLHDAKLKTIERIQWPVLVDDDTILSCPMLSISRQKIANQNSINIICVKIERV